MSKIYLVKIGGIKTLNLYIIYKIIEYTIFTSYLIFIFLSIQIWFLWKHVDKNKLMLKTFTDGSFFRKNSIYVFLFSIFFMIHEFLEGTTIPNAALYFEFFEMLAFICLSLFAFEWHCMLKEFSNKTSLLQELSPERES